MPVDDYGNRADVVVDPSSTISRMNLGRVYEAYLGATARDNRTRLINYLLTKYKQQNITHVVPIITPEDVGYVAQQLNALYSMINPQMVEFMKGLDYEGILKHVTEVLLDNLYIFYPTDNEYNVVDVIDKIESTEYKPYYTQVVYRNELGQVVKTKEKIRIGNMYIMALEKVADDFMAISSAKVNNFSFPVKGSNKDKYRYQHSITPTKTLGETEVRIFTSYMSSHAIAELMDINTNPNSHKQIIKNILNADKPMHELPPIDRNVIRYGQSKPLLIFKHIANAYGLSFKNTESS